jgi:TATA-binding protein-associated factor
MWKKWHIHDVIIQGLRKCGVHPLNIMKAMNSFDEWPSAELYVPKALDTIGQMLFGDDAYMDAEAELLHPNLRKPLTHIIQRSWNAIRQKNKWDLLNMTKLREAAIGAVQGTA